MRKTPCALRAFSTSGRNECIASRVLFGQSQPPHPPNPQKVCRTWASCCPIPQKLSCLLLSVLSTVSCHSPKRRNTARLPAKVMADKGLSAHLTATGCDHLTAVRETKKTGWYPVPSAPPFTLTGRINTPQILSPHNQRTQNHSFFFFFFLILHSLTD